jgi:hypothetical protein
VAFSKREPGISLHELMKTTETSFRKAVVQAEIQTEHFPNTTLNQVTRFAANELNIFQRYGP